MMDIAHSLNTALAGRYVIESEIGRGGMATVYLARDVRHDRHVALKLLNPELGAVLGVERFLSEIKVTANLHHPNLLPLFDSGEADGLLFYVMPFVAGESLRHRLDREKQLPVDEAVRIASAIASALAYAHAHQVIHRDLKPENILLQEGQPLVADFGIALAVSNAGGTRITQTGLSLGTPQYMSPEQATGDRTIDGRADIYSLGAILYEMLTGEPPHIGNTAQAIIARVLTERPRRVRVSRPNVPESIDAAVERALEKLPADRWNDARAFAEALHSPGAAATAARSTAPEASMAAARRGWTRYWPFVAASLVFAALSVVATLRLNAGSDRADNRVVRYVVEPPEGSAITMPVSGVTTAFSFSPDGKSIVYRAGTNGVSAILLHALNDLDSRVLPGTVEGLFPKYSPNGKWIAFVANGRLQKVSPDGGAPVGIFDTGSIYTQFDWLDDSTIVFARTRDVLWSVSASGGTPKRIAVQSDTKEEGQASPRAMGDGDLVLYSANNGSTLDARMGVFSVKRKKSVVFSSLTGLFPVGIVDEKLLYVRVDGSLMAAPFDRASMTVGEPAQVADGIEVQTVNAAITVSRTGDLAYIQGATRRQLALVDDHGGARLLSPEVRAFGHPRVSPDGKRIAFDDTRPQETSIWVFDPAAGTFAKTTSGGVNDRPEWTADATRLVYSSNRATSAGGAFAPWSQVYDGSTPPVRLYEGRESIREVVPTPDGRSFVMRADATATARDIFLLPNAGEKSLVPLVASAADELMPRVSPDGRWLAYISNESGVSEVYVRPLRETVGRVAISSGGGMEPVWAHHGTRLFYRNRGQLIEASLVVAPTLSVAARRVLFDANYLTETFHANYDVMPDDKSFVMVKPVDNQRRLVVVLNWRDELAARLAGRR